MGDTPLSDTVELVDKQRVWRAAVKIWEDNLVDSDDSLKYLREERGFTYTTLERYRIGFSGSHPVTQLKKEGFSLTDLRNAGLVGEENRPIFVNRIIVPYLADGQIVTLRGKQPGGGMLQARNTHIRLFGADNINNKKRREVFLCEGEFDAMLLDQYGYHVTAVPGALSFQEHWVHYFDDCHRIFIVMDADEAGRKGAEKAKALLGNRAVILELPVPNSEESTDVTDFFLRDNYSLPDWEALLSEHRSSRIHTLSTALAERKALLGKQGLKTGWKALDAALAPGLLPGQVAVVLAKTGVGKTAWLTQLVHNLSGFSTYDKAKQGPSRPVLMLSLEQTRAEVAHRLERIGFLYNTNATESDIIEWHKNFRINDDNRVPPEDLAVIIDEFIDEVNNPPELLIVDYLGYWARAFGASSKYEQVSDAIMELKRLAKTWSIPIVAPHQVSRLGKFGARLELDHARDSGVVEETADFAFALRRPYDTLDDEEFKSFDKRSKVILDILKSRHGNLGLEVEMVWSPYTLGLTTPEYDPVITRRIRDEYMALDQRLSWEDVQLVHKGKKFLKW